MPGDFQEPNWDAPLDLAERLAGVPAEATGKGMYFQIVVDAAKAASGQTPGRGRYIPYKSYPAHEWIQVLVECAELAYPRVPRREGMRRLGRLAYPAFAESMVGKVLLSVVGGSITAALRILAQAYRVSGSMGRAEVAVLRDDRATVLLRGFWDFPDAWHVGVMEGGLTALGRVGQVRVRTLSLCDADLELTWR
jgi:uncharacterized protein (TIGR02265 family)